MAALFALHPINVESVAWVAERKNVLSTLFFFLAIAAYVRYAQKPDWQRYLLVAAMFAAGLMAKPMVITLPFVLLLLDYWPLGRTPGSPSSAIAAPQWAIPKLLMEKVPLLFLSVASALITLKAQGTGHAVRTLRQFPIAIRIGNAVVAYGLYLWKMIWPTRLALYPHAAIALPVWQWILSSLVLIGITALVITFRNQRYLPVGWFWFLGTLVPVIGLVQVGEAAMADRYAYIPLIGIFVIVAFGLADLARAKEVRTVWLAIPALCVLAALSFLTHNQMSYWTSDYDLWAHSLEVNELNPFAHDAMGSALLDPDLATTSVNLETLDPEQRMSQARQHFEQALELRRPLAQRNPATYLPDIATTLNNLGNLDRLQNRTEDARQHYEEALKIHRQLTQQNLEPYPPDMALVLNNLGSLEQTPDQNSKTSAAQLEKARQHFGQALQIYRSAAEQEPDLYLPKVAETLNNLGFVERSLTNMKQAADYYEQALTIRRRLASQDPDAYLPYLATTLNDLGIVDGILNRPEDARLHYEEALKTYRQLEKQDSDTYLRYLAATLNNLAFLEQNQNRLEESRAYYTEDLSIFRKLYQDDPNQYAGDVARVEASLTELEKKSTSH